MLVSLFIALNPCPVEYVAARSPLHILPSAYERTAIRFSQRNERKPPFSISQ